MADGTTPNMISDLIDYKSNKHQVLINTAKLSLKQGSLDVLSFAQAYGDLYSLPSWVPYWMASDYSYIPLIRSWNVLFPHQHSIPARPYHDISTDHVGVLNQIKHSICSV
jgi:hypothetical protein